MELMRAHEQWRSRPLDERFSNLSDMHQTCIENTRNAGTTLAEFDKLRVETNDNGSLYLTGATQNKAELSHWSMGQLCARANAPASYIRQLPAKLAEENINYGLNKYQDNKVGQLLFRATEDSLILRSLTSDQYSRIWNSDITGRLLEFQQTNPEWTNPLAYEIAENPTGEGWPVMTGNMVPSGLYASDHDMFAFLVDETKALEGSPNGLNRGFFVWNSEVGAASYGGMGFYYDRVCGNNIVWGATDVTEFRIRHTGNAIERSDKQWHLDLKRYSESSANEAEAVFAKAKTYELGTGKEDILTNLLGLVSKVKAPELTRTKLTEAIDLAEARQDRYGNPNTIWAVVGGLTEASQWLNHADERMKIDKAAGKLLKIVS